MRQQKVMASLLGTASFRAVPWHFRQEKSHSAGVCDSAEEKADSDKAGNDEEPWMKAPRRVPRKAKEPAAIRTCRSRETVSRPSSTGRPTSRQACVPPSTETAFENPARWKDSTASADRTPLRQIRYRRAPSRSVRSAEISTGSRSCSGTERAPSTWSASNSAGVVTSIRSILRPCLSNVANSRGETVEVVRVVIMERRKKGKPTRKD